MTDLRNQRRVAASILKCGVNRVWMDQDRVEEIARAVTRNDIRLLIAGGAIKKRPIVGISKGRKKHVKKQKEKGRRRGHGSIKGATFARLPRKRRWISTIRSLRSYLKQLRDEGHIDRHIYRVYYRRAKGGEFRSRGHLKTHLTADGILKEEKK
ncbi:MAG: 50S ribosomal protein L19e [Thermoplasmata archaeon]|nr:50S ribosomal protein L19e [Thermoplasmata archaeon]RLF27155.1 MAG: 50S ribosomal protein L19e [Thermoplasmata archaeon]